MKRGIGFWKTQARRTLKGNFLLPITATFLVSGIQFIAGMFAGNLFPGGGVLNRILQEIFLFAIALIMCIFTAGLYYMYLNMSRGLSYGLSNLVYFFKNQPDRVIVASFVLALISWLTSLPAEWYSYTTEMGDSLEAQTAWAATYLLIMMVFMVVNLFVSIPFAMTYYILADEEEIGGFEALKRSICMMKGNIWKYILLQLSFIPWMFLSLFTMYIGFLWLIPYMEMSVVVFYRDLRGEFDPVQEITPIDLVSGSTWTQTEKEENIAPEENEDSGNDYNAEA